MSRLGVLGSLKPQDQRAGADRAAGAASVAGKDGSRASTAEGGGRDAR
jgi:hypothetical protein